MKKRFLLMGTAAALILSTLAGGSLAASQVSGDQAVAAALNTQNLTIALSSFSAADPQDALSVTVEGQGLMPGDSYSFPQTAQGNVMVTNEGSVSAYVRVTLNTYWQNEAGQRLGAEGVVLEPTADSGWIKAEALFEDLGTGEPSQVFYYTQPLAQGQSTTLLLQTLRLDTSLPNEYQGSALCVEAVADGVQYAEGYNEVNASGIRSSWGVDAALDGQGRIAAVTQ